VRPAYDDGFARMYVGDALELTRKLPAQSVHCVVCSPPYWGLRSYLPADHPDKARELGAERTPEEYVQNLVAIFRALWPALRDDGTLWLNLGDGFSHGGNGSRDPDLWPKQSRNNGGHRIEHPKTATGLKPKDLIGLPWMVAFALRADGWYLRQELIWAKDSCMPESVRDRCTRSHETIFTLTKRATYYYDREAIAEPGVATRGSGNGFKRPQQLTRGGRGNLETWEPTQGGTRNARSVWRINPKPYKNSHYACVDDATECLTLFGWKKHHELKPGDVAVQYDVEAGELSWGNIDDVARYEVEDEPLVAAKSRDTTLLLTPNHRTLIARRDARGGGLRPVDVIRADALKPSHSVPISAPWRDVPDPEGVGAEWAELLGWYVTEGHEHRDRWTVEIYQSQSVNGEKVRRIRHLLEAVRAEFSEAHASREWRGKTKHQVAFQIRGYAATKLRQFAPAKRLPPAVLAWHPLDLAALLAGLIGGDGHRRVDGRMSFIQRDKETADLVQAIGVKLGYATKATRKPDVRGQLGTWTVYFTRKRFMTFRGESGRGGTIETRPYTGVIWCPKLPKGTWVARRNGRVFITGNTFPPELPERCIKAGTSEYGVCGSCLAPWTRVVEREKFERPPVKLYGGTLGHNPTGTVPGSNTRGMPDSSPRTVGWEPTCACNTEEVVPATVLDQFGGSGTTAMVARRLGRRSILFDLDERNVPLLEERMGYQGVLL
jgi:DNA modification methylase